MENNTELKRKGGSDADPTQPKVRRTATTPNVTSNEEESVKKTCHTNKRTHTIYFITEND